MYFQCLSIFLLTRRFRIVPDSVPSLLQNWRTCLLFEAANRSLLCIKLASEQSISDAFPVLSWVIGNAICGRAHSEESRKVLRSIFDAVLVGCKLSFRLNGRTANRLGNLVSPDASDSEGRSVIVRSGDRQNAIEFLRVWLRDKCFDSVKICDPYFGSEDLEVLRLVLGFGRDLRVSILTSRRHQDRKSTHIPIDEEYRHAWKRISDQALPMTDIVVIGNKQGELPIHDRWWVTNDGGLRTGSSFNSLGEKKESEISLLTPEEAKEREIEVNEFMELKKREHDGQKLSIYFFTL
jgi:hypothetical protein